MNFLQYIQSANPDPYTVQYDLSEALYQACAGPPGTCPSVEFEGHLLSLETIAGISAAQAHAHVRQDETAGSGGIAGELKAIGGMYLALGAGALATEGLGEAGAGAARLLAGFLPEAAEEGSSAAEDESVNLASDARTQHILTGHMPPGEPGNTLFPSDWSAAKIMNSVSDVATDPANTWVQQTGRLGAELTQAGDPVRFAVDGVYDALKIRVIVEPGGEGIITGFPSP